MDKECTYQSLIVYLFLNKDLFFNLYFTVMLFQEKDVLFPVKLLTQFAFFIQKLSAQNIIFYDFIFKT
jgi:hypothetical protein